MHPYVTGMTLIIRQIIVTTANRVLAMYQEQLCVSLQALLTKTLLFASDKNLLLTDLGKRRDIIGMYWGISYDKEGRNNQLLEGKGYSQGLGTT